MVALLNSLAGGTQAAARVFNGTIAAYSVLAADSLGIFDRMKASGFLDPEAFASTNSLDPECLSQIMQSLATEGIVEFSGDVAMPGPNFDEFEAHKGFFVWLLGGYHKILRHGGELASLSTTLKAGDLRDGALVARGSGQIGSQFVDPYFDKVLGEQPFAKVCDLGCGDASRVIRLLNKHPHASGLGIDVNAGAVEVAKQTVASANMTERIDIFQGDALKLSEQLGDAGRGADLLTMFFMGHDLWPRERAKAAFRGIREHFVGCKRFLMADTVRGFGASENPPIFRGGFRRVHADMRQYIPTISEWKSLLPETGWRLHAIHPLGVADSFVFDLRP